MNSSQFSFRTTRSTELVCHIVVRNIYSDFDSGNYTLGVFLHLANPFDLLDRRIVFEKLEHYVMREWFKSYFLNRQQYFIHNKANCNLLTVDYGIPQGKYVGFILFINFFNELNKSALNAQLILFADVPRFFFPLLA